MAINLDSFTNGMKKKTEKMTGGSVEGLLPVAGWNKKVTPDVNIDSNNTLTGVIEEGKKNPYRVSDAYQKQADEIYKKIQDTPDFSYDFNEDAVFKALREQYMKDGKLAAENIQGKAAALSGGYGNSYGTTAAGQAYMGAIADLYDVVPELEEAAYGRYQDKKSDKLRDWEVQQNRADKERAYAESERDYLDNKDALAWDMAYQMAQMGDFSGLNNLGVDTTNSEYVLNLDKAMSLAEMGDYSGLEALGVDVSDIKKRDALDFAMAAASYGDYSFLKKLGVNVDLYAASGRRGSGGGSSGKNKTVYNDIHKKPEYPGADASKAELFNYYVNTFAPESSTDEEFKQAAQLVEDYIYGTDSERANAEKLMMKKYGG